MMTRAGAKLNISWPAEEYAEPQTSKLYEPRFGDRGQAHSRPTSLSPLLITTVMSWD